MSWGRALGSALPQLDCHMLRSNAICTWDKSEPPLASEQRRGAVESSPGGWIFNP